VTPRDPAARTRVVRWRLTVLVTAAVAVLLAVLDVALVLSVRSGLLGRLDAQAREHAATLAAAASAPTAALPALVGPAGGDAADVVLGPGSAVVASGKAGPGLARLTSTPPSDAVVEVTALDLGGERQTYRVATADVQRPDGHYRVVVGLPTDDVADLTRLLAVRLSAGSVLLTALAALGAWLLVGRALGPVDVALRDQRRFVADAAHELRSPIAALLSGLELLERDDRTGEAAALADEGRRLSRLADDLLGLARLDAGVLTARPVDLDDVVRDAALATQCRSEVAVDTTAVTPAQVVGDPVLLAAVARNLLDNATRHACSTVRVGLVATDPAGAVLTVTDDGPGIPVDQRERALARFARLGDDRAGSGLGLSIVAAAVAAHGGTVTIGDDAGQGCVVVVRLPVRPPGPSPAATATTARSSRSTRCPAPGGAGS
jgi:signal transduction histidine kinase